MPTINQLIKYGREKQTYPGQLSAEARGLSVRDDHHAQEAQLGAP